MVRTVLEKSLKSPRILLNTRWILFKALWKHFRGRWDFRCRKCPCLVCVSWVVLHLFRVNCVCLETSLSFFILKFCMNCTYMWDLKECMLIVYIFQILLCLYDFTLFYLQILDPLLLTLRTAIENSPDPYKCEETTLALRFIRSVARVFVVLSSQMAPPNGKRKV